MPAMDPKETYRQWLADGLKKPGKSAQGLAKKLGRNPSVVTRMTGGTRRIHAEEIPVISAYIEEPAPQVEQPGLMRAARRPPAG
mgnify:CR=1 FL=1